MLQYIGNTGAAGCPRSQKKESHIRAERNFFMLDRVQLKYEAKAITKNAAVSAYLFTLLYLAIGLVISGIDWLISGAPQTQLVSYVEDYMPEFSMYLELTEPVLHLPTVVAGFLSIVLSLVSAVLSAGYILYTMSVRRGIVTPYSTMFDGFLFAGKVILLQIVISIFVFLWSLLFVIPGIIAGYRYRFALYNLCENPEMGVMEALNMSKVQTRGHKWELFVLDLSFIGWNLLCGLTLGILSIWITPYIQQTDIGYFEAIKQMSGVGYQPPRDDGEFHEDDRFGGGSSDWNPER